MEHPEYIYYAGMVLTAPLVLFNRLAAVVVIGWAVAQIGCRVLPFGEEGFAWMTVAIDAACFVAALAWTNRHENAFAISLFVPMASVHLQEAIWHHYASHAGMHPYYAFWIIYWLALAQLVALPFGTDWQRVRYTVQAYRRNSAIDRALRWLPC